MGPGPLIRRLCGPYERTVTEGYRKIFIDLDEFIGLVRIWVPQARKILDCGCGEGATTERLVAAFPDAVITAIDIAPTVGRLYRGDPSRVTFSQQRVHEVADRAPGSFDLVVLCDVLHHIPLGERNALLAAIARTLKPSGSLVVKDWLVSATPIHWLAYLSDRYLTGDDVHFFTMAGARVLLTDIFGPGAICASTRVRPWSNNFCLLVAPAGRVR